MRKQGLRKYAVPGLRFSPGHGLLHVEAIDYIIRAAVKNIESQRVLAIYVYDRRAAAQGSNTPRYAIFQTRKDYITLEHSEGGALKWRSACLENLLSSYPRKRYSFYSQKDQQRVTGFCGIETASGLDALKVLQERIMTVRLRKRIIAREAKIIEAMQRVPAAPRGLASWIRREVLPAYVFYTYRNGKKPLDGWCSCCRHDVQVQNVRHNSKGQCPRCKHSVVFKAVGKVGKLHDRVTAQVLQRVGENEIVVRIFKAEKSYEAYRQAEEGIRENARFFIRWDDNEAFTVDPYYTQSGGITTCWRAGLRSVMNPWAYNYEQDTCGHLFLQGLGDVLRGTPWQYSQLQAFCEYDSEPLEVLPYLKRYLQYPFLEYMVKLRLYNLASHTAYGMDLNKAFQVNGRGPSEILGVAIDDIPLLQALDATSEQLLLLRALRERGLRADESLLRWYSEHKISTKDNIIYPLRHMTPYKLMQYIDSQFERLRNMKPCPGVTRYQELRNVLSEYCDYLKISTILGYDLKNTFVLFPRDLCSAHDAVSALFRANKDEAVDAAIGAVYLPLSKMYEYSSSSFKIIVPKTGKEIVDEGHALHHCVGSYAERMAKNECAILFLRRTDNIEKPFVTLRVEDGKLVENRGFSNGEPPPDAKAFLKRWSRSVLHSEPSVIAA